MHKETEFKFVYIYNYPSIILARNELRRITPINFKSFVFNFFSDLRHGGVGKFTAVEFK